MTAVIVAGALGVIIITGGLFLRRLLGQLAELRRQITGIDRQMRAQRAHVTFLRYLLTDSEDEEPPEQAAVVNGNPEPAPAVSETEPVRRKKHLRLYIGGLAAAVAMVGTVCRDALRYHRGQFIGAITGAAVTAATVTMVTVQPWSDDADGGARSSAPTAAPSATFWPPPTIQPPQPGLATRSPSPSASGPEPSLSASATPSQSNLPSPMDTSSLVPVGDASPVESASTPGQGEASGGSSPTVTPGGSTPPTESPPVAPPAESPPPEQTANSALCLIADVAPVLDVEACLLRL
ncbi:hypothetical protein [Streptomyces cylindrosporus]|uniref:Uncharacterized protein n=1 Tax=Streptomyces cylindrosporus TaxID=2927583 RepID=A0ABS9YNP3_9ACTN|nr:hypothetical protein [Streptomyces cylindrosporus]MCI3277456.1 hypothetical protein [Streptomyces cylindrosporus]